MAIANGIRILTIFVLFQKKNLGIIRKLKLTVKRNTLNQNYISFFHQLIWDNCSKYEIDRLERMQLEAARVVTSTTRLISTIYIYDETGWLNLEDRRKYQNFVLTYKIKNDMVPDYLNNLVPRVDKEQLRYGLRHMSDFVNLPRGGPLCSKIRLYHQPFSNGILYRVIYI